MANKLRGVIVGINTYQDIHYRERPLRFARADAEEVAAVLHRSNALQVENGHLSLLVNASATQENVWRCLNTTFATNHNFDQDTIAFFYFAGHGVIDPIEGDNIILGCHDVEHMNPNKGGVRLNDIFRLVQRTSAGCSIAIIDACFSGSIFDPKRIDHESPAQVARRALALVKADADKTIAIFTACSPDQVAREDPEVGHGVYTQELLRGLRDGEARDEHGVVDLSGLATYLSRRFAEDYNWQGPRSVVLGGRPVVLSYGEPRVPGTAQPTLPHPRVIKHLTSVDGRVLLPTREPTTKPRTPQEQLKVLLPLAGGIAAFLLLFVLANALLHNLLFPIIVAVAALALAIASFRLHPVLGAALTIAQVILLPGFIQQSFHWKTSVLAIDSLLVSLAGLLWLFWLLFIGEITGLIVAVLLSLMRPRG